jgi:hypothetical protein
MQRALALSWLIPFAATLAWGQPGDTLAIKHDAVACVVAGQHPQLAAAIAPQSPSTRGRIFFRAGETVSWYFVDMNVDATGRYVGVLPRPLPDTRAIQYYIEASDSGYAPGRTADAAPRVVRSAGDCHDGRTAVAVANAKVVVHALSKAASRAPSGFASTGVVAAGGVSPALLLGGLAVAGGATAGVVAATHKDSGPAPTPEPTPVPCIWNPNVYLEIGLQCADIQSAVRAGCPIGFQVGVGRWPTIADLQKALAGYRGVIAVDGANLPVTYEGPTIHTGQGQPSGYGNRARAVWDATVGTHTVTGFWTIDRNGIASCTFVVQ